MPRVKDIRWYSPFMPLVPVVYLEKVRVKACRSSCIFLNRRTILFSPFWLKSWDSSNVSSPDFLEEIKRELLRDSIYVFTPQGKVIELELADMAPGFEATPGNNGTERARRERIPLGRVFTLDSPRRLVLDLSEVIWPEAMTEDADAVTALRTGRFGEGWSRMVLIVDLGVGVEIPVRLPRRPVQRWREPVAGWRRRRADR